MQTVLKVNARTASIIIAIALVLGMPLFYVLRVAFRQDWEEADHDGRLSDRLAYLHSDLQGMERYAGNNVETVKSRKQGYGAIALTPLTRDASGRSFPRRKAANPNATMLVLLYSFQVVTFVWCTVLSLRIVVERSRQKYGIRPLSLPYHIGNGVFGGMVR